jgi:hypothetical protein
MDTDEQQRKTKLIHFSRLIERAALRAAFAGRPIALRNCILVNGPRAGAIEIDAGLAAGPFLRALQADDCALLRQFIPWEFVGDPAAFMSGRYIRLEAGWPRGLAEDDIPLRALGHHPADDGRWLVGRTERGNTLTAALYDMTPHWLVSGTTGSGKTTVLLSAVNQLSRDPDNRLILVDAKHGASLRPVANCRGRVGPLAADLFAARAALGWACQEMTRRYSDGRDHRRLIIVVDEVQDIANDRQTAEALGLLVRQGRGAAIHLMVATQHPVVAALGGPTTGRNLVGRLALKVMDAKASEVAIGASSPRADHLLGRGDAYVVAPGSIHRVQVAYDDRDPINGDPEMRDWPDDNFNLPDVSGWPSGPEVALAILSASLGEGRGRYQHRAEQQGVKVGDNNKAVRLLNLARETIAWMEEHGLSVCLDADEYTEPAEDSTESA